jgi:hypothetical protein
LLLLLHFRQSGRGVAGKEPAPLRRVAEDVHLRPQTGRKRPPTKKRLFVNRKDHMQQFDRNDLKIKNPGGKRNYVCLDKKKEDIYIEMYTAV